MVGDQERIRLGVPFASPFQGSLLPAEYSLILEAPADVHDAQALRRFRDDVDEKRVYDNALRMLNEGMDAPGFSASFFGADGEFSRLGTTREERERILKSDLYRWLKLKWEELRLADASRFDDLLTRASGRLTLTVPRSLHAALKSEAAAEGVSLSELIRLKLTIPYRQMADLLIPKGRARSSS